MGINFTPPKPPPQGSAAYEYTMVALTPGAPELVTVEKVLNAQMESLETGASQILGVVRALLDIKNIWKGILRKPTKANMIVITCGFITMLLWFWTKYLPGFYNYMSPGGIKNVVAFLFGTFNNVPTRILHFSSVMTLATAFLPSLFDGGDVTKAVGGVKTTITLWKKFISYRGTRTFSVMIISIGVGMFAANYMMRNCSYNKYFPCLTLGITIILSSSILFKSSFIKLFAGLYHDILRLFKLEKLVAKYTMAIQIGVGTGLVSSILACLLRGPLGDNIGYIIGVIIMVGGALLTVKPELVGKKV